MRRAEHWSIEVLLSVLYLNQCDRGTSNKSLGPLGLSNCEGKKNNLKRYWDFLYILTKVGRPCKEVALLFVFILCILID
jgi:hypothetical protein